LAKAQYLDEMPFLLKRFIDTKQDKICKSVNREKLLKTIETEHFLEKEFEELIRKEFIN